jgi:uncharacterized protein with HEPN domain
MQREIKKLLWDIDVCISDLEGFINGKNLEDFERDRMLQLVVERALEIIGEALRRLSDIDYERLSLLIPEFYQIIGLRNIIAHGYDVVDYKTLWDLVINELPVLKGKIDNYR